ncbi:MAG: hypothetical protein ACTSUB_00040 [Candidatus Thorarchaeota archaeon]
MVKIDDTFPDVGFVPTIVIVAVLGIILQLTGAWITMLAAGAIGALFTRTYLKSFLAGFIGVSISWTVLYVYLMLTAQASEIAEFFIGLLSLTGMGWLVFVIGVLLGGLLGGFGGGFGRSLIELLDEISSKPTKIEPDIETEPTE